MSTKTGQPHGPLELVVGDWVWSYGFLETKPGDENALQAGKDALDEGLTYLRTGDKVHAWTLPGMERVVGRVKRVGWRPNHKSVYENDLDMGEPKNWITDLAARSRPEERWDVDNKPERRILRNYVKYTYLRQHELNHLRVVGNRMGWNTGLVDENGDDIVATFIERTDTDDPGPRWLWKSFMSSTDSHALDWRDVPRATWWDDTADLIYDVRKGAPIVQTEHIVGQNVERLPKYMWEWKPVDQARAIQEAAKHAVERVRQNYKTAIPSYYWPHNKVGEGATQLLLPLRFPGDDLPSLALAVRREEDSYYGATVLKIEWAYTFARLLTRPDTDWLDPFHKPSK